MLAMRPNQTIHGHTMVVWYCIHEAIHPSWLRFMNLGGAKSLTHAIKVASSKIMSSLRYPHRKSKIKKHAKTNDLTMKLFIPLLLLLSLFFLAEAHRLGGDHDGDEDENDDKMEFEALGLGKFEVPPVASDTKAELELEVNKKLTKIKYELEVENGTGIIFAHLHCAPVGENGPVVAFVFGPVPEGVNVDGDLSKGTITDADIRPTACGSTVAEVVHSIKAGNVYLNVHSLANRSGEVRGQVKMDD